MLIFDIDLTLAPAVEPPVAHITREPFGFPLHIPTYLIDFMRSRDDIYLLSTWNQEASELPKAFGFKAKALLIRDFSDEGGIYGKFDAINALKPRAWADDQITPFMAEWCAHMDIYVTVPKTGYVSPEELNKLIQILH